MESSVLALRLRCRTAVLAVDASGEAKVDCQRSEWNSWPSCNVTCSEGEYNRSGFERGHWTRACPITGRQVFRDDEEAKTSFFVYFGRDHSMSDYIGKSVTDTGCSRFLIGQNNLEKWEQMLTRRLGFEYAADPACEGHDIPFWQL